MMNRPPISPGLWQPGFDIGQPSLPGAQWSQPQGTQGKPSLTASCCKEMEGCLHNIYNHDSNDNKNTNSNNSNNNNNNDNDNNNDSNIICVHVYVYTIHIYMYTHDVRFMI